MARPRDRTATEDGKARVRRVVAVAVGIHNRPVADLRQAVEAAVAGRAVVVEAAVAAGVRLPVEVENGVDLL